MVPDFKSEYLIEYAFQIVNEMNNIRKLVSP